MLPASLSRSIAFAVSVILATVALGTLGAAASQARDVPTGARSVTLSQADANPRMLRSIRPHASLYVGNDQCVNDSESYYSDVSAYTGNGGALGPQAWTTRARIVKVWRDRNGHGVTFDGVTFRNHTPHVVLVAGWCA